MLQFRRRIDKMKIRGLTIWLFIFSAVLAAKSGETAKEARVVCYYTNWSVYRPGTAKFNPQNINPYLCTHLIYAFGGFTKENTLKPFDKYQDIEKGGYAKFTGLKTYNPNLKTMIAIGGWNEGSSRFSSLVASSERRREFVKNTVKFLRQNKFDGLDLDWEYPSFRDGGKPEDRKNYGKLVQELREEYEKESQASGRPRLLLTMAVPAGIEYIDKGYDIPKLNRYLDWMNLLTYDYHSAFEPSVNHHAPLYPLEAASEYNFDSDLNIEKTINHYLEAGADSEKLVLGIPTYGRSYTLINPDATAIGSPADGPGAQGEATREKGYLAYYEICENLIAKTRTKRDSDDDDDDEEYEDEEEEWVVVQPNPRALGPYAYKGDQWVGYDDIDIVRKKAEYVAEKSLGGIMFWSIDNDDFRGKCHGKPYPLIEAAKESLFKSLGISEPAITKKPQGTRKRPRPSKPSKVIEDKETEKNYIKSSKTSNRVDSESKITSKTNRRRPSSSRRSTTTESTPVSNTPAWGLNTPEPPTTPDPGSDFKCTEEGFFPHPRDCKKYFWCLESGPSNLGIVAHQFTCPSGLHFNKAADSCDFARNVLCNKKKAVVTSAPPASTAKAEVVTTEKSTTTSRPLSSLSSLFTTRRPAARITAATSSTTLLFKSTTPTSIEEEYDEDEEALDEDLEDGRDSEEDPRVIKELVDLIKKLGGVEQLEKHLANSGQSSQATTPPTIKKLFYERVLSQPRAQNERAPPQQNSRGPQTLGLSAEKEDKVVNSRRERPQYTTINRQRPATTERSSSSEEIIDKDVNEEVESKIISTSSRPGLPQYVNIRRVRPSTTEEPQSTERYALFERENESEEEEDDEDEDKNQVQNNEYSTINRFRTSTTERTTSKYKTIQRIRSTTSSTTTDDSVNAIITTLKDSVANSPTEATVPSSSVSTSSQASSIIESTTIKEKENDVTEVNDVSEAVSPSFASENGVILNAGSSSVLNAQITTLSNTPKATEESSVTPSSIPVAYSTKVTISEEPITSTQRSSLLFAKRTRPTTTVKPQDISEQTTDNKVSFDRKYANIKRTRVSASSSTSSPLLRAPLRNQIADDFEKVIDSDSLGDISEAVTKGRLRTNVRKIRSTTPASQENQDPLATKGGETDYGNKRFGRPQLRFTGRKLNSKSSSEEDDPTEQPPSNSESLTRSRPVLPPRQSAIFPRTRSSFTTTSASVDNEGSGNEFVQTEVATTRTLLNRRFRPSLKDFNADLSSLTGNDRFRAPNENVNNVRVSNLNRNVQRRFRPAFTSTTEQSYDDLDEENAPTESRAVNRQRLFGNRGGNRFSVTDDSNFELNTEASEASVYSQRNLNIQRFTPRPFSATTLNREINLKDIYNTKTENENELIVEAPYESQLVGKARLTAPVINVSEEDKAGRSLFKLSPAPSTASSQQSINVTKIINSNILLGQTNNKSGILLLRRPSRPVTTSAEKVSREENSESIQLSETAIEEKEHDEESNVLVSNRPRKRIVVKRIRSTTVAGDVPKDEAVTESINIEKVNAPASNQTGRQRVRKVLRKRPITTTTVTEPTATEKYEPETDDDILENAVETSTPSTEIESSSPTPRVRKILRKVLKPVKTDDGKTRLLQTGEKETVKEVSIGTRIDEPQPVEVSTSSSTTLIDNVTPEILVDDILATVEPNQEEALSEQSTVSPSSTRPKPDRLSYRPLKRPIGILTSTEPSTTASKSYSRKFNNAPYTTPLTPDQVTAERIRVTPRRPTFSARPINRRPVSTARTTTTDEDDFIDEDDVVGEEPEDLVFVPLDQLFTRGPTIEQTGRKVEDNAEDIIAGDGEEEPEEEEEVVETSPSTTPSTTTIRFANRINSPLRTSSIAPRIAGVRQPNRPVGFNRPIGTKPSTEEQVRKFNRPTQQRGRFGTSTSSPREVTTRSFSRKFTSIRTPIETLSTTEAIREAIKAKHTQLFSNPKKFSLTTAVPLKESADEDSTDITTDLIETTTDMFDMTESDENIDALFTTTEDSAVEDESNTESVDDNEITTMDNVETAKPTTERQVFSLSHFNQKNHTVSKINEESLPPIINILTTSTTESTPEKTISEPIIKTSTQLDKLFEVSRVVEVSSTQEKHRLNRKNESRLIEKTERKLESKPKFDKIGEVSRFTLIKIVEGDIPIYLTNLSHEYPVPNPPNNPIRIDEARNARNLINFSDSGKENLIASESVNAAYNHRNAYIDIIDGPLISDYDRREYSVQSSKPDDINIVKEDKEEEDKKEETTEEMPTTVSESRFVPGAVDLSELTSTTTKSVAPKVESSTLSLESLFKSDDNSTLTARKVKSEVKSVVGNEPFVVYASPGTTSSPIVSDSNDAEKTGRSLDTSVKIQVIRPDEKPEKKEFFGVPAAAEAVIEKDKVVDTTTLTIPVVETSKTEETSKAPDADITIANLDKVVLKKVENVESGNTTPIPVTESPKKSDDSVSTTVYTTVAIVEENQTTTKAPETESSIINIKPAVSANDTLSKIAKKRPKLTFPRRNQLKSNNATRLSIIPSPKNKINATTVDIKNVPFTTPKYNRTNSYTSGRSRFSAIRSQNVPIDARKSKAPEPVRSKVTSTTEAITKVPTLENPKKVTIKPLRPGLLRSSPFRRTTTLPPTTQISEASTINSVQEQGQNSTQKTRPGFFPRRSSSRFSPKPEQSTTPSPKEETRKSATASPSLPRRRLVLGRRSSTTARSEVKNATEPATTRASVPKPSRLFVRKYAGQRSGTNGTTKTTTVPPTTVKPIETTSRRGFRIGVRRRPTTTVTTQAPETTTVSLISSTRQDLDNNDQESHSTIQATNEDIKEGAQKKKDSTKRPFINSISDVDDDEEEENVESQNVDRQTEKIYSSVIKEDHTLVQQEKKIDNSRNEVKYDDVNVDDVTADVAVAAHQLLAAPLPTIPSYALDDQSDSDNTDNSHFTRAYLHASSASPIVTHNDFISTTEFPRRVKYTFPTKSRRISTTESPRVIFTSPKPVVRRPQHRETFQKIVPVKNYRTFVDYEYYDDDDIKIVGKNPINGKVVVHDTGVIQCLDQGNFPHPNSCKKFISCARMENGGVVGWAYTCPKGLSFDPVGGICNWSAGLGCRD